MIRTITGIPGGAATITFNSTATASFDAGDILTSNGSVVTRIVPGTGVATALAAATNGTGGLVTYSGNIGAATATSINGLKLTLGGGAIPTNVSIGNFGLQWNTGGGHNIAIGDETAAQITTGGRNIAIGSSALVNNDVGSDNIAIGVSALEQTAGDGNIAIGSYAGAYETGSNSFYVNNRDRLNLSDERTKSLLYGTFAETVAGQQLTVNAGTFTVTGAMVGTSSLTLGTASATAGSIVLQNASNAFTSTIQSGVVGANKTWTWPTGYGSAGQVLTDAAGDGTLSWSTASGMTYPGAGVPKSTGSAWDTSYTTTGSGTVLALATSPQFTTSITTDSTTFALVNTTATTVNAFGAATTIAMGAAGAGTMNIPLTTEAASSITGSLKVGNGTAATNVGIGGGNINAGGTIKSGGAITSGSHIIIPSGTSLYSIGATNIGGASGQNITFRRYEDGSYISFAVTPHNVGSAGAYLVASCVSASATALTATASGSNVDINLVPKGTGVTNLNGTGAAVAGTLAVTGTLTPTGRVMLPMGEVSYFDTTGTLVTISSASDGSTNMVVVAPATTLNNDMGFDNGGADNGRLRYTGTVTKAFHVAVTLSGTPATVNDVFVFGIAKNGTVQAASKVLGSTTGTQFSALHLMVSLATNDYLELYVGNTSSARNITIKSLNLFAMGM